MSEGIVLLAAADASTAARFAHAVVDSVINQRVAPARKHFGEDVWSSAQWAAMVQAYTDLTRASLRYGKEKIGEAVDAAAVPEEVKSAVQDCLTVRADEIFTALVSDASDISPCRLNDFDWKIHMVMSSDTLANVRTPVLLLELQPSSHPANGLSAAPITVELDRPGLTRLMASLDKANEAVQAIKTV